MSSNSASGTGSLPPITKPGSYLTRMAIFVAIIAGVGARAIPLAVALRRAAAAARVVGALVPAHKRRVLARRELHARAVGALAAVRRGAEELGRGLARAVVHDAAVGDEQQLIGEREHLSQIRACV